MPALKARLAERGSSSSDIRHLLLSHIHLDHAGAAGTLVREHPGLQVHVSAVGAPHLVDPSRLERAPAGSTATRSTALGRAGARPGENIRIVGDDVLGLEMLPEPGPREPSRLIARRGRDALRGRLRGGQDLAGAFVLPPTPPPDIDLEAWDQTIDEIGGRRNGWR